MCWSGAWILGRCFSGLQALGAGTAVKDDFGGRGEKQNRGGENGHAN